MVKTNFVAYPAVLDDSENQTGEYSVLFPDVPGALSEGVGIPQALSNGAEALELMLYDEEELPEASDLKTVQEEYPQAIVSFVTVDLIAAAKKVKTPVVRKNTTIPEDLAERADSAGINFSETLTEALKEKLEV
ncbi:type II toxin-antitoxin system HicB family antitoxin [Tetragenococcus muriaticus]|uniref:type II toxin-antitoxin system HicB family antitoxin n=1 Tax=Tetragenococcus muriaticus TaxID=64642 RepID=UPI0003FB9245|nr:type II toxin-antitoxin system HicB family antitoxin [Tetragenococcus muriaticus]GMA45868.1 hypothetical protein GCM10025854_01150 [Tetragenococcus muriaticus]GMA46304.1 hypothetical protein GCM10025854_05530 [Tetragenococcus muriaticus]GMA46358.1 hypothetical protein GCM10025854_06080 [Tetragenococcus muriaticus]